MPALKYALGKGEPRRLVLSWRGFWMIIKDLTIRLDRIEIGSVSNIEELGSGKQFPLGDNVLKVKLDGWGFDGWKFKAFKDEQLLVADPTPRLRHAYEAIFLGAGLFILGGILGLIGELFQVEFLKQLGIDYTSIILGAILVILGFFVKKRSLIALGIATGLYILDSILIFFTSITGPELVTAITIRIFILIYMFRGFSAIRDLKQGW
jgi:hypothetical protein